MDQFQPAIEEYNSLEDDQKEALSASPAILDAWVNEVSDKLGAAPEVIKKSLKLFIAGSEQAIEKVVALTEMDILEANCVAEEVKEVTRYRKASEINSWAETEQDLIKRDMAVAYLRKRRIESESLTYQEVSQWTPTNAQIESVFTLITLPDLLQTAKPLVRNPTSSRRENIRQGILINQIINTLDDFEEDGATKTKILKYISKDTGRWRKSFDPVMVWMVSNSKVYAAKDGRSLKYYLPKYHKLVKESLLHRKIFEFLRLSPSSRTSIVNYLTYNNAKGHKKVLDALKLLQKEGLIYSEGTKWRVVK
tara:strand:- start:538 stop:1461 length:924 start_codon:yes stop_codon:yes gene_type:complete